jgi:hypothetical protein
VYVVWQLLGLASRRSEGGEFLFNLGVDAAVTSLMLCVCALGQAAPGL